ncbi:MAG: Hsp20/alpha crystallin family protein [Methanobacteriaceae archaeon]|nr:Hsp20/alpha crystallin family protein [Methanobacteriaceae archaeon]
MQKNAKEFNTKEKEEPDVNNSEDENNGINAEKILNDIITGIQDKTEEFGKTISDYKTSLQKPLTDVIETENSIIIKVDLPGVNRDNIDLGITEDSVEIKVLFEDEEEYKYLQKERNYGKTMRTIVLPVNINTDNVKASFKDSILVIELFKKDKEIHKVNIN